MTTQPNDSDTSDDTEVAPSNSEQNPKERKYPYFWLFAIAGVAAVIGAVLQQSGNPWFGASYAVAIVFVTIAVWLLSRDPDFWLVGQDGNLNPEVPQRLKDARQQVATWIEEQDARTPLTPGRRLLAVIGVYLGGVLVLVPVCAVVLPADWPYPVLTGFGAAFCLVVIDVIVASQTTKWPTVIRGTRSFLKGIIGGGAIAGTWVVTIGLVIGMGHAMNEHNENLRPQHLPFALPRQHVIDNLSQPETGDRNQQYWTSTICVLYPLLGDSRGEAGRFASSSTEKPPPASSTPNLPKAHASLADTITEYVDRERASRLANVRLHIADIHNVDRELVTLAQDCVEALGIRGSTEASRDLVDGVRLRCQVMKGRLGERYPTRDFSFSR